ncbi:serine--tRNA ligase [Pacificimonas sp. WHA3]|uniref:Serine--tRNA ligase n=1 Tax=Pacificimonas pallii TaxID=2827236 RepID=A0ABS6SCC5_9SPHN|nr:serine--tRNA ligase [Pacificimonas pallii]MBV7256074.1 serine--tRNA ligase [Pacificimonas pallii]
MHDIKILRDDPTAFDGQLARRGHAPAAPAIVAADAQLRAVQTELQAALARRNEASKAIGRAMGEGDKNEAERLKAEVAALKETMPALEERERTLKAQVHGALAALPNHPADDVPPGDDEGDNVLVKRWGDVPSFDFEPKEHDEIGAALGLDFAAAAEIAGARFAVMRGPVARLHRAIGQLMLDLQTNQNGYTEVNPPVLVRDEAMFGTGQLPKFAEDSFRTEDGRWLISTSEISLTNLVREQIVGADSLPMRFAALTLCFRSEAGAAGRDTKGMIRQHQFEKVELVSIIDPGADGGHDASAAEFERKVRAAETVLETLGLPYRRMQLCVGDMSAAARRTVDLEVWLPGQDCYREISSVSEFGDFQARRMNARTRGADEKKTRFVHTLNGSGLAVGRTLVAVLENYQRADGSVAVPDALRPYMGGTAELLPAS